ncbi:uncharacterized protein LTHEOB_12324, partial [Neofusicoccum parvum]
MRLPRFWRKSRAGGGDEEAAGNDSGPTNTDGEQSRRRDAGYELPVRPNAGRTDSANSHTSYSHQGIPPNATKDLTYQLWRPFFLRKLFLFALIVLFILIGITLGVLYSQSRQHNGLSSAREGYYYLWTYGPTAVFTSIAALWAQVEYRSKQLMPWNALQCAPQCAENSVLLDYVDPMNVVSLFHSARKSHFFVSVAIAGALTAQLMVVLSSGLFEAVSVMVLKEDAALTATEVFTGEYDYTLTSRPATVIYGRLLYNLSYPLGTTQDYAYQLFNTSHSSVENMTATVDVFSADLDCSRAAVDRVTSAFATGGTENTLLDGIGFTITTDSSATDVWVSSDTEDANNCTGMVAKVPTTASWGYNGSYCANQEAGSDRNRLVMVFGSWDSEVMSTLSLTGTATSTEGLIPASLLAGQESETSSTATRSVSTAVGFSTASPSPAESTSSGNDIQLNDPTSDDVSIQTAAKSTSTASKDVFIQTVARSTSASSKDVFIQIVPKTTSAASPTATSSGDHDIQLDDPTNDLSAAVLAKRADDTISSAATLTVPAWTGSATYFVLPTSSYTASLAIVCKPRYTVRKANVTLSKTASTPDTNTNTVSSGSGLAFQNLTLLEGDAAQERQLDNFTAWAMMSPVFQAMELSNSELSSGGLMSFVNAMAPSNDSDGGDEVDRLIAGLQQTYRSISAQVANEYLTQQQNSSSNRPEQNQDGTRLTGKTVAQEMRLAMQAPAFWITEVALLLAVFGTSYLLLNANDMKVSHDPSSVGGLATILARSKNFMRLLAGTGAMPLRKIREEVLAGQGTEFAAGVMHAARGSAARYQFLIDLNNGEQQSTSQGQGDVDVQRRDILNCDDPPEWYHPFAVSLLGRVLIASVPLALIIALEVLYQYSARHDGLADIDNTNLYVHYVWTFVPTLAMVGVGQLFGMLDFATKVFAPYSALSRPGGDAASILDSYLNKLGVHALYAAFTKRQWAVAAAAVATVLSPFLTIVTSGLLNAAVAPANYTVIVTRLDDFSILKADNGGDGIVAANLVYANNLSYPQWTHDTLALPRILLDPTQQSSTSVATHARNASTVRATVPAVRGVANCTIVQPSDPAVFGNCTEVWRDVALNSTLVGNEYSPNVKSTFSGNGYFGNWGPPNFSTNSAFPANSSARNDPGCPPIIASFGRVADGVVAEVTHMACAPYIERVEADVVLELPAYRIVGAPEASAIGTGESWSTEYWAFSAGGKEGYKLTNPNPKNDTNEDLASLFGLAVWGPDGVPKGELATDEEVLVKRVEKVYAQVMAQVLNVERDDVNATTTSSADSSKRKRELADDRFQGTILDSGRTRLKQSPVSTRILEGLLATMFICAALTFALLDTRKVLPKNPCSIAAVAMFTSIATFWAQVEYRSKQMMPWVLMAQGPQTARNSLLLDYIEPMNIVSLYNSFLNRHWMVVAAIAKDVFNMTALVDVFSADLSCEVGTVKSVSTGKSNGHSNDTLGEYMQLDYDTGHTQTDISMDTGSCSDLHISVRDGESFGYSGSSCSNADVQEDDPRRLVLLWGTWANAGPTGPVKRAPQNDIQLDDSWTTLREASLSSAAEDNTGVNTHTIDVATSTRPSLTGATITAGPATTQTSQHVSTDDGDLRPSGIITGVTKIATSDRIDISPTPGVPFTIGSLTLQLAAPTFSPSLGLVCKPSYSIRKGSVTLSKDADGAATPSISFSGNETASTLPNVTSWDVLGAFAQSVAQAETSTSSPSLAVLINATLPQPSSDADTTAA